MTVLFSNSRDMTGVRNNPGVGLSATWRCAGCGETRSPQAESWTRRIAPNRTLKYAVMCCPRKVKAKADEVAA